MPLRTKPLNNYCLIEVIREDEEVSRMDENESMSFGKLVSYSISSFHLTASSAHTFSEVERVSIDNWLQPLIGKVVRWEQYAEGGQTFDEDGKTYALIPFWRLISASDED